MEYTMMARNVQELRRLISDKRHLIGREESVLGGIYAGSYGGEAIVVDYDRDPLFYDSIADQVVARATRADGSIDKSELLDGVYEVVSELLPYSKEAVDNVNEKYNIKDYQKISLSVYVDEKAGVCRHQALLVATVLEILKNRGVTRGAASIERSIQWPEEGDPEGHAWVRYTNGSGEVFIIDVAQNYIGTLEESQSREMGWNYLRPEEAKDPTIINRRLGNRAIKNSRLITQIPDNIK
jgi:hypothetical protein